jgi:hypothetical protein
MPQFTMSQLGMSLAESQTSLNFRLVVLKIWAISFKIAIFSLKRVNYRARFLVYWEIRAMLNGIGNGIFNNPWLYKNSYLLN